MDNFFNKFKLRHDQEEYSKISESVNNGVAFRGTNLWVLIFAIFVASLGLNLNSTAVIIGAMLISPLMGPIMGIGLGVGVNDLPLLRTAIYNYFVASGVALTTSTFFFLVSPLNDAHSEILARTAPSIYDVMIAFFGGLAGIVATASKQKGNVIPGVAIATALMPPLCTAGYGLATANFQYFFGALYLFVINTVFIALATFLMVRLLGFPFKRMQDERTQKLSERIIWAVVLATLIPSIYFGYDLVRQDRFNKKAALFISNDAQLKDEYLLNKQIDPKARVISLVYGGRAITQNEIDYLKKELDKYKIGRVKLEIKQGFAYLNEVNKSSFIENEQVTRLSRALEVNSINLKLAEAEVDSVNRLENQGMQLYKELKAQYPQVESAVIRPNAVITTDSTSAKVYLVLLDVSRPISYAERTRMQNWLKVRLPQDSLKLVFQ